MRPLSRILTLLLVTCLASCDRPSADRSSREGSHDTAARGSTVPSSSGKATTLTPDPITTPLATRIARGKRWVAEFECGRCHEGTGVETPPLTKQCVGCHQAILTGRFTYTDATSGQSKAPPRAAMKQWREHIVHLRQLPSLADLGQTLRPEWITEFLLKPVDLRPALPATMPRLPLSREQASDIAAYLTRGVAPSPPRAPTADAGDVARGAELFKAKGCGTCHAYGGTDRPAAVADPRFLAHDTLLAPDLAFTRDRFRVDQLDHWLSSPQHVRKDALMPDPKLSETERHDLGAYVMRRPLPYYQMPELPKPLPLLKREVTFDEVNEAVFRKVCWHCHAQPDFARGDGGPGMTGGFGFKPRRLDLSEYSAILGGYLDEQGERRSVFTPAASFPGETIGRPMLLAVLYARQREERREAAPIRGMPLGLPSLSPEQIQLVASWIDQGRPR